MKYNAQSDVFLPWAAVYIVMLKATYLVFTKLTTMRRPSAD